MRNWMRMQVVLVLMLGMVTPAQAQEGRYHKTVEQVIEAYLQVNGGIENIKAMTSLRMTGRYEAAGQEDSLEIVMFKKRPDLKKLIARRPEGAMEIGYDGKNVWRIDRGVEFRRALLLKGEDARVFLEDSTFDGPLVAALERDFADTRLVGVERFERTPCYVVEFTEGKQRRVVYLDARNFRELKVEMYEVSSGQLLSTTLFDNYQQVSGVWFAMEAKQVRGNDEASVIRLEKVDVNVGVFDSYFAAPADAE